MRAARCCIADNTALDRTIISADKNREIFCIADFDAVKPYYEVSSASLTPSSGLAALIKGCDPLLVLMGIEYVGLFCLECACVPSGD